MNKRELYELLRQTEERIEKERPKRAIKAILFFSAVYFILFCVVLRPNGIEFLEYAMLAVISGVIHLFLSTPVFHWLFSVSDAEDRYISEIRKKLSE